MIYVKRNRMQRRRRETEIWWRQRGRLSGEEVGRISGLVSLCTASSLTPAWSCRGDGVRGAERRRRRGDSAAPCLGALRYRVRVCADSARGMVDGWVAGALAPGKAVYGW
ncbi:unnamed protein product [Arctogadus glacialis]